MTGVEKVATYRCRGSGVHQHAEITFAVADEDEYSLSYDAATGTSSESICPVCRLHRERQKLEERLQPLLEWFARLKSAEALLEEVEE